MQRSILTRLVTVFWTVPWRAVFVSPLVSVPVAVLSGLGSSDAGWSSDAGVGVVVGTVLALPVSYVGMLFVGVPAYLLSGWLRRWQLWCLFILGCGLSLLAGYSLGGPPRTILMVVLCGCSVTLLACILAARATDPKDSLEETRPSAE